MTAVHVIEVPTALPMHAPMTKREEQAEGALKRAEAVAREYNQLIDLKLVRSRTAEGAILELIATGEYDMVIVSTRKEEVKKGDSFALEMERLFKDAPCRILFCKS